MFVPICLVMLLLQVCHSNDEEWELIGYDEFDSPTIDLTKWGYDIGNGCENGNCGWGNNELEYYTNSSENSFIQDGNLIIKAIKENYQDSNYTSARLVTRGKSSWRYGKFKIRAQVPSGQGLWPAIWMLPKDEKFGSWPRSGEIDIVEILGDNTTISYCIAHYGNAWNHKNNNEPAKYLLETGSFSDDYHIFEIQWEEDRIEWFIDGNSVFVLTASDVKEPFFYPFNEDFYLVLNLAVGGFWPGNPNDKTNFPAMYKIDYVRIYKKRE